MDAVLCQARLKRGPEAEAAVGLDAVMSQAEAEAGRSGIGWCDESGRGRGRQERDRMV